MELALSGWSLKNLFTRSPFDDAARSSYRITVEQARQPEIYREWKVPDSATGRFDVIALHGFLLLHRFRGEADAEKFAEAYCGAIFDDMDRNLREMGVGDLSVGKQVRKLAEGFYGRAAAYEAGLKAGNGELHAVLKRNLYAEAGPDGEILSKVADYVRRNVAGLAEQDIGELIAGHVVFAPLKGSRE